ncbi:hypothetical protein B0T10DRAFT_486491 [Thelonectria olida]|uniref:Uncharacterized protein n=1 Tax=Thelonectria olida TaxID=1576542 RepID=A0A9P9APD5_9HYPO|nr:hypothetical protein B0T10DRAFT_486491 [Thelonectria olida]
MSRTVAIVHCPLSLSFGQSSSSTSGSISNPFSHQLIDHYAVEVGESGRKKRYSLRVKNASDNVDLNYEPEPKPGNYEPVRGVIIETDVVGLTSYSDEEILRIAQRLIEKHGRYHPILNNCKRWATEMFNTTCDVKGRTGAIIGEVAGGFLRALWT